MLLDKVFLGPDTWDRLDRGVQTDLLISYKTHSHAKTFQNNIVIVVWSRGHVSRLPFSENVTELQVDIHFNRT